ncbi:MAG: twin-arginine translocase subunit TatC [Prevotellaceae bacterium]|jgi:sec-independent protein translocase protein TatC|nr:twin-arginine translocase subunit TatC [Prevotellaceae bacterium]
MSGKSPDELSFWEHLDEVRKILFRLVGVWLILAIGFFIAMPYLFDHVILAPCNDDFITYDGLKWLAAHLHLDDGFFTQEFHVKLININLAAPFFIHISTSLWLAVVISVPFLLSQIWVFISPALYEYEKQGIRKALFLGTGMFFIGVAVGYFVIFPLTLRFLTTYDLSVAITNEISLNSYIDNFMMLILSMGIAFELPLVTWLLSLMGIVNRTFLRKYRRHALIIIVAVAAIITPTGDPFTLTAVSIPLYLLYELSILMVKKQETEEVVAEK